MGPPTTSADATGPAESLSRAAALCPFELVGLRRVEGHLVLVDEADRVTRMQGLVAQRLETQAA